MKCVTIGLLVLLAPVAAPADDPKPAPAAGVVVSGKPVGLVLTKTTTGGETKTVRVSILKLGDDAAVAVALPPEKGPAKKAAKPGGADPDLEAALREATGEARPVAAAGRLSSTDDPLVVAAVGPKGAKRVPLILADRVTELADANKKDVPPPGSARVDGVLVRADIQLGPDTAKWAIDQKEPGPVPLLLPADGPEPTAGARVRATGTVRVVDGRFVVRVKELAAVRGD
ncbi:MAG: hypothetical protein K2X87_06155 [Gemmataceae bacterium]|nr:hypothetical protein [Gemmataceae bacterium]